METRKITVVSTKTQQKSVIMSAAETLAQLKADLRDAGIDYENMTFYEGVSKTELLHDSSPLPTNVPYTNRRTGETINTNELVFMLTNKDKKIASGADRKALYDYIKERSLQNAIKEVFGKNFTQCKSEELSNFIENMEFCDCQEEVFNTGVDCEAREAIKYLINDLYNYDIISAVCRDTIMNKLFIIEEGEESPYSDDEIDEMMEFIQ